MKDNVIGELINSIKEAPEETQNTYSAVVSKVDSEGVVWVHLAGSTKETPTVSTSAEIKRGDAVNVEWRNNKLYIAGNYSNPSAGTERVGRVEKTAKNAEDTANNAESVAQSAQESAQQAQQIAADTEQHFWFTETGEDTGAHITEVTQEEWNDSEGENYHSGGNLLARSNGIAVRDGLEEIASLGADGVTIGKNGGGQTLVEDDGITMLTPEGATAFEVQSGTGSSVQTVTKSINQTFSLTPNSSVSKSYSDLSRVSSGDTFRLTVYVVREDGYITQYQMSFTKGTSASANVGSSAVVVTYNGATGFTFSISSSRNYTVTVRNLKYSYMVLDARVDVNGHLYLNGTNLDNIVYLGNRPQTGSPSGEVTSLNSNTWKVIGSFTVPKGVNIVDVAVGFGSNATGRRQAFISSNNTNDDSGIVANIMRDYRNAVNGTVTSCHFSYSTKLTADTTYYIKAYQNSGSQLTISARVYVTQLIG